MAGEDLLALQAASILSNPLFQIVLLSLILWDAIWKGIALWKCGRNNQMAWFIAILLLNTVGILPIIYLLFFQAKQKGKK